MMSQLLRQRRPLVLCAAFALLVGLLLAPTPAHGANPPRQMGDLLVTNHSFEDGLDGWTPSDGKGEPLRDRCRDVATTGTANAVDGEQALQLPGQPPCRNAGVVSSVIEINPGWQYTAFADVRAERVSSIAIRWLDADGAVVDRTALDRDRHAGTIEVTGTAPDGAVAAAVELGAVGPASFDRVLFTAQATVVGPQISKAASYLSSAAGHDEAGAPVVWAVGSGSATSPAVLIQVDPLTRITERTIQLPGATGSWTVEQGPDGTVYVGTYGSAALWSYTPGSDTATRLGTAPIAGTDVLYGISIDENNVVYGGVHASSGAGIWTYTPGEGFGTLGPHPLVSGGDDYNRAGGYDPVTKTVLAGTGPGANIIACSTVGDPDCIDLIGLTSPEVQTGQWGYGMTVDDGYAMAWIGPGNSYGNDYLVIFKLSRASDGTLQASVVDEIKGVAYNASSGIHDGKVYYTKAPSPLTMYSYDLATGTETRVDAGTPAIFARSWDFIDLQDPAWPGETMVGLNSGGDVQLYNPQTGRSETEKATDQPVVSVGVNSITNGPDGRIWSSAYLVRGLGAYVPMRDDQHQTWGAGGQAEGMTSHAGRIWQGIYPSGSIQSFDPSAAAPEPITNCTIEPHQSRPYGILGHGDRIYWGTMADYGETAGAFGYYDIEADSCTTIPDVLGDQTVVTIAASGSKVYAGTMIYGGINSEPKEQNATVISYDEETGEAVRVPLPVEARSVNASVASADGTVWFFVEGWLLGLDPETDTWIHQERIFDDKVPGAGRISAHFAQMVTVDGTVYGNANGRVFGFDPVAMLAGEGKIDIVYDGTGGHLAVDEFGNLYTTWNSTSLLRLVV